MALQFSDALRNAMLNQFDSIGGSAAKVKIYTGAPPATVATAATGTLLATFTLSATWMGAAGATLAGRKDFTGTPSTTAVAPGTAGYFRLTTNSDVAFAQGTIGTTGADLNLDNTNIANGQSIQITSWQITAPGA